MPKHRFSTQLRGFFLGGHQKDRRRATNSVDAFDQKATGIDDENAGPLGLKLKLVKFAERHNWNWLGRMLQVIQRYGTLQGNNVASAVALQIFLSLFPMLLVAAAVLGFVLHGHGERVSGEIISQMGLTGNAAQTMNEALNKAAESRKTASILGFVTLFWSAIGVSSAMQYAINSAWMSTPRGLKDKAIGTLWLGGAAILFVATMAASTLVQWLPAGAGVVSIAVGMCLNFLLWMFTLKVLPNVRTSWRDQVPGAVFGAVGMEVLKFIGTLWVPHLVASSSGLYGTVGVVFAVLAWVVLFGKLVVYAATTNVMLHEGRHGVVYETVAMPKPAVPQ